MRLPTLLLTLFMVCIMASCVKEKTDTVTVTKYDTLNHTVLRYTDTLNLNVTDTVFRLLEDTVSASVDGTPYFFNTYSDMTITTYPEGLTESTQSYHEFSVSAHDSAGDYLGISIATTDSFLIPNKTYGSIGDNTSIVGINYINATTEYETGYGFATASTVGPTSATITSINGDEITGTFQGNVYYDFDVTNPDKRVISNGLFKAVF
ncbi:MAG TPA: hypothetical protein VK559_08960 [Ferruginibacter sp.]|nr:hypothetical protein [Ferruginibacter sp.]